MINVVMIEKNEELISKSLTWIFENSPQVFSESRIVVGNFEFSDDVMKTFDGLGIKFIDFKKPYNAAYILNKCIAATNPNSDILFIGSGVSFITEDFVNQFEAALLDKNYTNYGIISPVIDDPPKRISQALAEYPVNLLCLVIRRNTWNEIGGFSLSYGTAFYMFMDFFRNVVESERRLGIIPTIYVKEEQNTAEVMDQERFKQDESIFNSKWGEGHYFGDHKPMPDDWRLTPKPIHKEIEREVNERPELSKEYSPFEVINYTDSTMRYNLTSQHKAPPIISKFCKNTDFEMDGELLWSLMMLTKPKQLILSGAGQAAVIKIVSHAANQNRIGCSVTGIDPNPRALKHLTAFRCKHICMNSIDYAKGITTKELPIARADMIIVDEDPHAFEQTTEWLNTWLPKMINPGGFILFHDIIQNRPEIQVKEAVREWVKDKVGWKWTEFEAVDDFYTWPQGGLGLLSAPKEMEI